MLRNEFKFSQLSPEVNSTPPVELAADFKKQNLHGATLLIVEPRRIVPVCEEDPYPRLTPGEYDAQCVGADIYRDKRFRRWVCRLQYWIIPEGPYVYGFLNLGAGAKPRAGRGSEYRRAWIHANGNVPRKREKLGHSTFVGKNFLIRVGDVTCRQDGRTHLDAEIYSTAKEVVKRTWP